MAAVPLTASALAPSAAAPSRRAKFLLWLHTDSLSHRITIAQLVSVTYHPRNGHADTTANQWADA